jgi:hypothetical protein
MGNAAASMICSIAHKHDSMHTALDAAFRQWAGAASAMNAVEHQVEVADLMYQQLETTREKLHVLKSHLKKRAHQDKSGGDKKGNRFEQN